METCNFQLQHMKPLVSLKGRFPFRLGTTSYIIPADILPNVRFLADQVDDIELILFEADEVSNLPDKQTIIELNRIAGDNQLSYTVHLPLNILFGATNEVVRQKSVETCLRVIELTEPLRPFAYILHLTGNPDIMGAPGSESISEWIDSIQKSCHELTQHEVASSQYCVETLNYPFELIESVIDEFDFSICLDVGHILLNDYDLHAHLDKYWHKTRVVHLHGIVGKTDHQSILHFPGDNLKTLLNQMTEKSSIEQVLTLEIFSQKDFESSISILRKSNLWKKSF